MFMVHSIYAGQFMAHPLEILQAQILRAAVFSPRRVRQTQGSGNNIGNTGGSITGPTTITPPVASPTPTISATEASDSVAKSAKR